MRQLQVLIACEESQRACIAFRQLGHKAFSCDIQPCSGGHPEWHLQGDVRQLIGFNWDLIVAHPPCTYLAKSSATSMYAGKVLNQERFAKAMDARAFFMLFYECQCPFVAIENPTPLKCVQLPPYSQIIQPYEFGDPYSKRTVLWLKNLPPLFPTAHMLNHSSWVMRSGYAKTRSKSFGGIAAAMAEQWSDYILKNS